MMGVENETLRYLREQGFDDLLDLVDQGMSVEQAWNEALTRRPLVNSPFRPWTSVPGISDVNLLALRVGGLAEPGLPMPGCSMESFGPPDTLKRVQHLSRNPA